MADLSQYLDFAVQIDLSTNSVVVDDISVYPEGVAEGLRGRIIVTQPDGFTVKGQWGGVKWDGIQLTKAELPMRMQTDGFPQCGSFTVLYEIDHPDYDPTELTRTFEFHYSRPAVLIKEKFDVFSPKLELVDESNYASAGLFLQTVFRLWDVQFAVGNKSGITALLDLAFSGSYYDALYDATLRSDVIYQHTVYPFLTVKDRIVTNKKFAAKTPPTFPTLQEYLKQIKERFDGLQSCEKSVRERQDYEYAGTLLSHIKSRICKGDFVGLYGQIQDFLNVYYDHVTVAYQHTNNPIPTYDFSGVDCEGGNGGTFIDIRITQEMINNWNLAFSSIPPDDFVCIVGVTTGAPSVGSSTFTRPEMVNRRIRLIINRMVQATIPWEGNGYYAKPLSSDTLTLYGMTFNFGDLVHIQHIGQGFTTEMESDLDDFLRVEVAASYSSINTADDRRRMIIVIQDEVNNEFRKSIYIYQNGEMTPFILG